ncbi:MAG: tRNA (adenosine(37)-N6)-dimethylallyltransferase MiaA [Parasporobacterium sp.]|nr:tRNA (adenosine(37)-N6)-dimethylallyltransferase MiaA [Parasporobacterium sp.]
MKKEPLVIIAGATAVGKTELSLRLAERIGAEIISADSMQVYQGFNIGTAKISRAEMRGIPHYLIDILQPEEEFNIYEFQKRALDCIQKIRAKGRIPMIVGGTGFYIQSVLYGIDFSEESPDKSYRRYLEGLAAEKGPEVLYEMLKQADPVSAEEIHFHNVKRVIRALEFYQETGTRISEHNLQQRQKEPVYNSAYFVLNRERSVIYDRINRRVDQMLREGLVEEVKGLLADGVDPECLAMQGLGYKEILGYLNNERSLEEAVSLLKQNTRHFAKRQITWFKREKDPVWINYEDFGSMDDMLESMIRILKEKKIV